MLSTKEMDITKAYYIGKTLLCRYMSVCSKILYLDLSHHV